VEFSGRSLFPGSHKSGFSKTGQFVSDELAAAKSEDKSAVPTMRLNQPQKAIIVSAILVLLCLVVFPPWRQAAEREIAYRKDLGHGFLFRPPKPVSVACYWVGCKTAPPSYFHILLYRELLFAQCLSVLGVTLAAIWIFRRRRDGTHASVVLARTRIEVSMLLALLFPPIGTFPLASLLLDIPKELIHRDELWLMPAILVVLVFSACSFVIYLLVSSVLKIYDRRLQFPSL
jgi:hypothetical protein